jgi:hypothetical protein
MMMSGTRQDRRIFVFKSGCSNGVVVLLDDRIENVQDLKEHIREKFGAQTVGRLGLQVKNGPMGATVDLDDNLESLR